MSGRDGIPMTQATPSLVAARSSSTAARSSTSACRTPTPVVRTERGTSAARAHRRRPWIAEAATSDIEDREICCGPGGPDVPADRRPVIVVEPGCAVA
ncbi:hypothetical protein [Rhodococcus sp. NBC_00297]|uniref:hypothetical protein n=1 Tax=Rhodococcus sp. NBC_00297 TaxID=2976005 RepID=UPI002E2DC85F|nr:hypothetical protein [Rhodococcus sp. NBC_00297]